MHTPHATPAADEPGDTLDTLIPYIAARLHNRYEWTYGALRRHCASDSRLFGQAVQTMMDMGWVDYIRHERRGYPAGLCIMVLTRKGGEALGAK